MQDIKCYERGSPLPMEGGYIMMGYGTAPEAVMVNISATLAVGPGRTAEQLAEPVREAVDAYLLSIQQTWDVPDAVFLLGICLPRSSFHPGGARGSECYHLPTAQLPSKGGHLIWRKSLLRTRYRQTCRKTEPQVRL